MKPLDEIDTQVILRPGQVAEYLGCSLRQVYVIARDDPDFPPKLVFSSRFVGFRRESLDAYLKKKEADLLTQTRTTPTGDSKC